jgi:hypothetical protein
MKNDLTIEEKELKNIIKKKAKIPEVFESYKSWS